MAQTLPRFRVLLVVRDATERAPLAHLLEPDFELESTGSPDEAFALLKGRPFEVLLAEQNLEGRTGSSLAEEAAALPGALSSILLADQAEDVSASQRAAARPLTVVVRPWHAARLVRLLEQAARLTLARRAADALQKLRGS